MEKASGDNELRVLYLPFIEPGYPALKRYKRGLREALARVGTVVEIDWRNELDRIGRRGLLRKIAESATELEPTLILAQVHDSKDLSASHIRSLRRSAKSAILANWNGDYQDFAKLEQADIEIASAFDLQLVVSFDGVEEYIKREIRSRYWQIGWEPDGVGFEPGWSTRRHHVLFLANRIPWYPARRDLVARLRKANIGLGLYGLNWPWFWTIGRNLYDFKKGCRLIRAAKLVLADNPRPNARGYVSNRLFQSLAAGGALVLLEHFDEYERLGIVDGEHLIVWKDAEDLIEKTRFWCRAENEDRRRQIAAAGQKFCLEHHSFDVRVRELLEMIAQLKEAKVEVEG